MDETNPLLSKMGFPPDLGQTYRAERWVRRAEINYCLWVEEEEDRYLRAATAEAAIGQAWAEVASIPWESINADLALRSRSEDL